MMGKRSPAYYKVLTMVLNLVFGNLVLLLAPLAAIRFNYTVMGMGLPTSVAAVLLLFMAFRMVKPESGRLKIFLLALLSAVLVPVAGTFAYFGVSLSLEDIWGVSKISIVIGTVMLPMAIPFVLVNLYGLSRYKKALSTNMQDYQISS